MLRSCGLPRSCSLSLVTNGRLRVVPPETKYKFVERSARFQGLATKQRSARFPSSLVPVCHVISFSTKSDVLTTTKVAELLRIPQNAQNITSQRCQTPSPEEKAGWGENPKLGHQIDPTGGHTYTRAATITFDSRWHRKTSCSLLFTQPGSA